MTTGNNEYEDVARFQAAMKMLADRLRAAHLANDKSAWLRAAAKIDEAKGRFRKRV